MQPPGRYDPWPRNILAHNPKKQMIVLHRDLCIKQVKYIVLISEL